MTPEERKRLKLSFTPEEFAKMKPPEFLVVPSLVNGQIVKTEYALVRRAQGCEVVEYVYVETAVLAALSALGVKV